MKTALKIFLVVSCLLFSGICGCYSLSFLIQFDLPELTIYHHGIVWGFAAIAAAVSAYGIMKKG